MNRVCTKCNEEKSLDLFMNDKRRPEGKSSWCKSCYKAHQHERYNKYGAHQHKLDHYVVYYLPEEHYCGHTNRWPHRKWVHKGNGKNIEGARVLYCCETKEEAVYHEALFCSVLGLKGLKIR